MISTIDMKEKLKWIAGGVVLLLCVVILWGLFKDDNSSYKVALSGDYNVSTQSFPVKKGVVLIEVTEGCFFVQTEKGSYRDFFEPWSETVFITVSTTFDRTEKKIVGKSTQLTMLAAGDVMLRIYYNNEHFNPLTDYISTVASAGNFSEQKLIVTVSNVKPNKDFLKITPRLANLPKKEKPKEETGSEDDPDSQEETTKTVLVDLSKTKKVFSSGLDVYQKALGVNEDSIQEDILKTDLNDKSVKEIKLAYKTAKKEVSDWIIYLGISDIHDNQNK
jgi:hypothetical protein